MATQFVGTTLAATQVVQLYKTMVTRCVGNTPGVTQVVTLCKTTVCVSVFSGGTLGKPDSPHTSRQLTSGEHFKVEEHHANDAPEVPPELPKPASAQEQPAEVPETPAPAPDTPALRFRIRAVAGALGARPPPLANP